MNRFATVVVSLATAAVTAAGLAGPAAAAPGAPAAPADTGGTNVVINEVYGGGGNSGATYKNDFIELYNPTSAAISLDGWSVQYASATGTSWTNKTNLSGSIAAGGYYLVQESAGSGGMTALPTPDATGSIAMSGTAGKVALVSNNTSLSCSGSCATAAGVVDFIGFGSATDFEGTGPAPTISNATSDSRTNGLDTDQNATDFTVGAPSPQNSGGGAATVAVTNPGGQSGTVDTAITPITLTASGGDGNYTWSASGLPAGLSLDGAMIGGTPTTAGSFRVTVTATDGTGAKGSAEFAFEIAGPAQTLSIAQIQGTNTDTSPYNGKNVITTGVVTAAYPTGGFNGFYLQTGGTGGDPAADTTPGASDAVFVFGSRSASEATVGESVSVAGQVQEYQGMTEITSPTVTTLATALPAVTATTISWDQLSNDAAKEAHEGELIAPQGDFTVTDNYDTNYYGSFLLAAGTTPLAQPTDVGAAGSDAAKAALADNARRTVSLDDGSSWNYAVYSSHTDDPLPWLTNDNHPRIGAAVSFTAPVILEYRFDAWTFQPRHQVTDAGRDVATFEDTRADNQHPSAVGGDVRLATFNVENYFAMTGEQYVADGLGTCTWYDDRAGTHITDNRCSGAGGDGPRGAATTESFLRQQAKIVTGINRLDAGIVSLEEVENSVKFGQDRDSALAGLVDALNAAAGSDEWAYVPSPDAADLPTLAQQDVIRTAFIYKPALVSPVGASRVLTDKSGDGQSFSIAREPLAQAFTKVGTPAAYAFLVVANHFKSKGSGTSLFDDCVNGGDNENTDPAEDQGAFNCTRVHEAKDLMAFADQTAKAAGTDKIFLLGDFNAYTHEDPMLALYAEGYTDLGSRFADGEASYSYGGLAGSLDHVLANPAALAMVTGADVWQINAQESVAYNYSRYNYNVRQLFDGADPFAASDHNPEVVGLTLPSPAAWNASTVYQRGDDVYYDGSTWRALRLAKGKVPGDPHGPWEQIVEAPDGTAIWTPSRQFDRGDVVLFDGTQYEALRPNRDQKPGALPGVWKAVG
ncbi:ExeM/NucH family extracellular endonuclease [Microbacterium sp.]|uniref:ExeM/NucH family extracellular endonuclease n=1 Tax=Microbacterium sp. TaxID=51671 RepID=UPI003A9214ED